MKAGILKLVSGILAFGLSVVLGRALGAEAAGIYFLALTIITIAATVGRAGLDSAVLRVIAAHASVGQWANVGKVHRTAAAICLAASSLIAVLLIAGADLLANTAFSDTTLATPLRIMAIAIVPLALSVLTSRSLLGLSRIRDSIMVFSILPYGIALGGTWFLAHQWGVNGAVVAYIIAIAVAFAYGWAAWNRALDGRFAASQIQNVPSPAKQLLRSGAPLLIGALLQLVITMSGTLMLGMWAQKADVSLFAVAWRTAFLITFVLLAVNTIAQPKFAELFARGEMESLAATANRATQLMTICATPVLLICLVAPEFVMGIFGSEFEQGASTLQILSVGQFVNVASGSVGILILMSGHERDYRNVQIMVACVILVLNVVLIPLHGAVGAAIAAATALILQNVLFGYYVWARLGILTFTSRVRDRPPTRDN